MPRRRKQQNWSHQSSPCSSEKSVSPEPRGSRNKGSVSCLQDISRGAQSTQTEELAQTSKIPDRAKAPLASRCNKGPRRRKRRSERVTDRVLNGSTHGEASKLTQSQGSLERKMKHLSSTTNTDEITDTKCSRLSSVEGATAAPHPSTLSTSSWETAAEEPCDDVSDIRHDKPTRSKFIGLLRTISPLSSASATQYHTSMSLRVPYVECLSLQLGTSQCPDRAPVYRDGRLQQHIRQPERERSIQRRVSATSPAFTFRPSYWQIRSPVPVKSQEKEKEKKKEEDEKGKEKEKKKEVDEKEKKKEEDEKEKKKEKKQVDEKEKDKEKKKEVDEKEKEKEEDVQTPGASIASTLQFSDHACAASTSAQIHKPNVDKEVLVPSQKREEDLRGAAAAKNTHPHLKDSSKDIVCRPKQRPLVDLPKEENMALCRICYCNDNSPENPLVSPCRCKGSVKYIHLECLKRWILVQLQSKRLARFASFCEICGRGLKLDLATFDLARFCSENKKKGALQSLFHYIGRRFRRMRDWRNPRPPEP